MTLMHAGVERAVSYIRILPSHEMVVCFSAVGLWFPGPADKVLAIWIPCCRPNRFRVVRQELHTGRIADMDNLDQ